MVLSLVAMAVLMLVFVGFTGLCSFNPGRPENGPVHEVDAETFLRQEASRVPFPVRAPEPPAEWTANSARAGVVAGHQATILGYVTAAGDYVQLLQTDAPADALPEPEPPRIGSGERRAGGLTWRVAEGVDADTRTTWTADAGDLRLEIQGSAAEAEYRTLAEAAAAAEPVAAPAG